MTTAAVEAKRSGVGFACSCVRAAFAMNERQTGDEPQIVGFGLHEKGPVRFGTPHANPDPFVCVGGGGEIMGERRHAKRPYRPSDQSDTIANDAQPPDFADDLGVLDDLETRWDAPLTTEPQDLASCTI